MTGRRRGLRRHLLVGRRLDLAGSFAASPVPRPPRRRSTRGSPATATASAASRRGLGAGDGRLGLGRLGDGRLGRRSAARRPRRVPRRRPGSRAASALTAPFSCDSVGGGLGGGDVAPDVDPPAGEPRGEPRVLALAADRERQHPLGHGHVGDAVLLVDVHAEDLGGRQRVGDEHRRILVPRDHVDLLAGELRDHRLHAGAALARRSRRRGRGHPGATRRRPCERLPASRAIALISTVPAWISGTSSSNRRSQEALVRARDEDLRSARRPARPRARRP